MREEFLEQVRFEIERSWDRASNIVCPPLDCDEVKTAERMRDFMVSKLIETMYDLIVSEIHREVTEITEDAMRDALHQVRESVAKVNAERPRKT